jgi:hypothetical protein
MKTKVFEPGAICAAVALLLVLSLPAYAKSGGSTSAHTRVGKTSANTVSVKPVTSSRKTQSGTGPSSGTSLNATSSKTTQSGTVQKSDKSLQPTVNTSAGPTYKNLGALGDGDVGAISTIVTMEAAKGAREDLKGIMGGVKKSNTQKSDDRSRKYKPY